MRDWTETISYSRKTIIKIGSPHSRHDGGAARGFLDLTRTTRFEINSCESVQDPRESMGRGVEREGSGSRWLESVSPCPVFGQVWPRHPRRCGLERGRLCALRLKILLPILILDSGLWTRDKRLFVCQDQFSTDYPRISGERGWVQSHSDSEVKKVSF